VTDRLNDEFYVVMWRLGEKQEHHSLSPGVVQSIRERMCARWMRYIVVSKIKERKWDRGHCTHTLCFIFMSL